MNMLNFRKEEKLPVSTSVALKNRPALPESECAPLAGGDRQLPRTVSVSEVRPKATVEIGTDIRYSAPV